MSQEQLLESAIDSAAPTRLTEGKDVWDKVHALGPAALGLFGVIITGMIGYRQDKNRESQQTIEIINQREQSDMDFKAKIFEVLLGKILTKTGDPKEQLAALRLFEDNFHETFRGRAFFDAVKEAGSRMTPTEERTFEGHLRSFAMAAGAEEERIVESNVHVEFPTFRMKAGDSARAVIRLGKEENDSRPDFLFAVSRRELKVGESAGHVHRLTIRLDSVFPDHVHVSLGIEPEHASEEDSTSSGIEKPFRSPESSKPRTFEVSFFDAPFTDNTLLPDGHRLAVILKEVAPDSTWADLKVLEFPADYIVGGYRPQMHVLKDMMKGHED